MGLKNPNALLGSGWLDVNWYKACPNSEDVGVLREILDWKGLYEGGMHCEITKGVKIMKVSYMCEI